MIKPFFGSNKTNLVLQAAQEGHALRHRAIVNNIANVDTPGYQRIEVPFETELKKAVNGMLFSSPEEGEGFGGGIHFSPTIRIDTSGPLRADGSNVSIDREMAALAKNAGKLNALTELMIRNYRDIKSAINGR
jgi:flagellar basal-body rod protein FlgB